MPRFLISFDDGSMEHIPEQDWPAVGAAAHAVVRKAKAAGVWIFGGGIQRQQSSIVATDGTVSGGPVPETKSVIGGFRSLRCLRGRRRSRGQRESPKGVGAPRRSARSCSIRSREASRTDGSELIQDVRATFFICLAIAEQNWAKAVTLIEPTCTAICLKGKKPNWQTAFAEGVLQQERADANSYARRVDGHLGDP